MEFSKISTTGIAWNCLVIKWLGIGGIHTIWIFWEIQIVNIEQPWWKPNRSVDYWGTVTLFKYSAWLQFNSCIDLLKALSRKSAWRGNVAFMSRSFFSIRRLWDLKDAYAWLSISCLTCLLSHLCKSMQIFAHIFWLTFWILHFPFSTTGGKPIPPHLSSFVPLKWNSLTRLRFVFRSPVMASI